jgi:cytochrome c biogenesis protein CcmG/thiol:disulfide interchange protein DsbE
MVRASRIAFGLACLAATSIVIAGSQGPVVDAPAPDFHVVTFDGKPLCLSDFKGQVLILNFWATWCTPCKRELPLLNTYYRLQEKAGLRVVAITTEDSLPLSKLRPLAANLTIPMARSFRGKYGPQKAVPTNYIIDRDGILRYAQAGELTLDALNEILVPMLRAAPAADPTT